MNCNKGVCNRIASHLEFALHCFFQMNEKVTDNENETACAKEVTDEETSTKKRKSAKIDRYLRGKEVNCAIFYLLL